MHYIILDLEWNQPVSFQSEVYRRIGDQLLFEVIQIGAVKMDEQLHIIDSISIPVHPSFYQKIHPRIKRITGLTQDVLCDADTFPEAIDRFMKWCGEDTIFLTWGGDDISVLSQNIECFQLPIEVPPMYDLQKHYAKSMNKGGQVSLKDAMDALGIEAEEDKSFHNAVYDAYYTGLVFSKLPQPEKVKNYPEHIKKLRHSEKATRIHITHTYPSVREALDSAVILTPQCPGCHHSMKLQTCLIPQTVGRYIALTKCSAHGLMFMKIRLVRLSSGEVGMNLNISPCTRQNKAYTRTKEYQYQFRKKRGDYDSFDPENLTGAMSSNMPFEEQSFDKT